jgi:transposase InsO family protein
VNALGVAGEARLASLLEGYSDILSSDKKTSTLATTAPLRIELKDEARGPFVDYGGPTLSQADQDLVEAQVKTWLDSGVVVPSDSANRTYLLVARNKGKPRVCPAFLALNAATVFQPHPLPTPDEVRLQVGASRVFSTIDLTSAFTSMPLDESTQDLTTFRAGGRTLKFTRVQWGLVNAATTFQAFMETVLLGVKQVFVYVDDILLFSDTEDEMLALLDTVLGRLKQANLLVNSKKSKFIQSEVSYLGNIFSHGKLSIDPDRTSAITAWKFPSTASELKSFLGAAAFVSEFIQDYGKIKGLLHPLLSSKSAYLPTKRQRLAFDELKAAIKNAVSLSQPIPGSPLIVRTDASSAGLGAVLYQEVNGERRILHYLSRTLKGAEIRYPAQKLELLAIKYACNSLRHWLIGCEDITIITDHKGLLTCLQQTQANATLQRWAVQIGEYKPKLAYLPGSTNHMADFLSRHPSLQELDEDELADEQEHSEGVHTFEEAIRTMKEVVAATGPSLPEAPWSDLPTLRHLQDEDEYCSEMMRNPVLRQRSCKRNNLSSLHTDPRTGILLASVRGREVIVAPRTIVQHILRRMHDERGHFRLAKTTASVNNEFYWPGMHESIKTYLDDCIECAQRGSRPQEKLPEGNLSADEPNELVSSDIVGPFPLTAKGMCYIVTFTCNFSKFNVSVAIKDITSMTVTDAFTRHWVAIFGPPRSILTDNGTQYTSLNFDALCKKHGIRHIKSTPYNPRGNGIAERWNRTLMAALSKMSDNPNDWDDHLFEVCYAHNASTSATTQQTPYLLMFGRPPPSLVDLPNLQAPDPAEAAASLRVKNREERERLQAQTPQSRYHIGDAVLLNNPVFPPGQGGKRLHRPFKRLRYVTDFIAPNTLCVRDGSGREAKVHMRRVKLAPQSLQPSKTQPPPPQPPPRTDHAPAQPVAPVPISPAVAAPPTPAHTTRSGRIVRENVRFKLYPGERAN